MTKLERLNLRQARLLNELTKQCQTILAFTAETSPATMICRKDSLEEKWADIRQNTNELESLSTWTGSEEFNQKLSDANETYLAALAHVISIIPPEMAAQLQQSLSFGRNTSRQTHNGTSDDEETHEPTIANFDDANPSGASTSTPGNRYNLNMPVNIKLPPLKIKVFSGDKIDWPEFRALCESTFSPINNECTRFQYLKGHLAEEPARLIQHLPITDGSYARAWDILVKRYDNERIIINANLKRLMELPVLEIESARDLKTMLDTTNTCLAAINSYDIVTANWHPILIFVLCSKLDSNSIKHWEERIQGQKTVPKLQIFLDFLEMRINILETTTQSYMGSNQFPKKSYEKGKKIFYTAGKPIKCTYCSAEHRTFQCPKLLAESPENRNRLVIEKKLCQNCLFHHKTDECKSSYSCRICGQRHNSILHSETSLHVLGDEEIMDPDELQAMEMEQMICTHLLPPEKCVKSMLPTAMIRIKHKGKSVMFRALLDQGSTADLITQRACDSLGLPLWNVDLPITGVGGKQTVRISKHTQFDIAPYYTNAVSLKINAFVLPYITSFKIDPPDLNKWKHLKGLQLADPKTDSNGKIDVLLGTSTLSEMLLGGLIRGKPGQPIGQKTSFGWIISGKMGTEAPSDFPVFSLIISDESLSSVLQKFWESEEIPKVNKFTPEEQLAEDLFVKHVKRCDDGRFMVKLPFQNDPKTCLGDSLHIATRRYQMLEKRFSGNPDFWETYNKCINEYLELGHMELTDENSHPRNYLPHHPVIKDSSSSTKVRPVFDASCKTDNGKSLNSQLLTGPTIQPDLFSLLIHWRKNKYAFTGDIEKMYRQIWVYPEDAEYQRILHKPYQTEKPFSYRLKTVTFGTACAPFLAIRSLFQIGEDIKSMDPELSHKIQNQFYVDDYLDSAHDIDTAKDSISVITTTLAAYGFKLRKWKANVPALTEHLPISEREDGADESAMFKMLGIQWQAASDQFVFLPTELPANVTIWTKRKILSDIAKLFDPMGWLSPCIILAKMFMQGLWLLPIDWDTELPENTINDWLRIRDQFVTSCSVRVPRWLGIMKDIVNISLHGFSDASEKSCACVAYIRLELLDGTIIRRLLAAKTKVAPVKKVSLPRLELNAALLLAQLMVKIQTALQINNIECHAWTDSTIVLCWLADHPNRWKTYVANRVSEIQGLIPSKYWKHIESSLNPADCASRGLERNQLEKFELWWQGPDFLGQCQNEWPESKEIQFKTTSEERKIKPIFHVKTDQNDESIFDRFSDYSFMIRVLRLCLSWRSKAKHKEIHDIITFNEMETRLSQIVQTEVFKTEISCLSKGDNNAVDSKSSIRNLDPQLNNGILRVGGRIQKSMLSLSEKHPIILPAKHQFTNLLIQYEHLQMMHGGLSITLQKIRQRFWIVNGKTAVNSKIRRCITCFRFAKKLMTQKMGNLPSYRLQKAIPFTFTGVDYAGYFNIKSSARKNAPFVKGYIAVFICLTTRALHLELVSDLSTTQFIKALKRFISRRGIPQEMYSDNGTNFTGASKEIQNSLSQAVNQVDSELSTELLKKRIKWSFIPARAPHFGGWESGVKLVKHHLKRVLGEVRLTFEDFNTVIIEIEAIVNSRPLWAIPTNVDEYEALTPGHFLVFRALNTLPEPNVADIPMNRLSQYQYLCRLTSDFWKLWQKEYVRQLQVRKKWQTNQPNLRKNQIVLVAEDIELPTQWSLGRIIEPIKGEDGLVRVADILCRGKIIRRSIHKLALLPIIDNNVPDPFEQIAQPGENGETHQQ